MERTRLLSAFRGFDRFIASLILSVRQNMKTRRFWIICGCAAFASIGYITWFPRLGVLLPVAFSFILACWLAYTYSDSAIDRIYNEYIHFDDEMREQFLARTTPEVREEIMKREQNEK
jgi:hypothetical protein